MNQLELNKLLDQHEESLSGDREGVVIYDECLAGLTLKGRDLSGIVLERCNMYQADLSECTINRSVFRGSYMVGVKLDNTRISKSDFNWVSLYPSSAENTVIDRDTRETITNSIKLMLEVLSPINPS